jgi:hypothetical protein
MAHEQPVDEFRWLSISRRRRLSIGDLMVGVAVTALACLTVTVTLRSSLSKGDRVAFSLLVVILFALQTAQWKLSGIRAGGLESALSTLLGILSYMVGMTTFVGVFILACVFAEGAAYVVVTMLVLIVYLTTWD